MKLTYDPRCNVAYLEIRNGAAEVETILVGEDVSLDVAPDGTVVGIEFLNANDQLRGNGSGQFVIINEADGNTVALPLAV